MILSEFVKSRRPTHGSSSQVDTLFGTVPTNISIIEYGELLAPWFHNVRQQNHPSTEVLLSVHRHRHLCLSFDSVPMILTVSTEHHSIYQKILADILVDIEADASTFNMIRWKPYSEHPRITFAAKNLKMGCVPQALRVL